MKKEYNLVNFLKFICAVLVVLIHTVNRETKLGYLCLITARVAVPFFFMITGYFMAEKIYKKDYEKVNKYIKKIFYIYVFWSVIYILFVPQRYFSQGNIKGQLFELMRQFLFFGTYDHLWYLITCCVAMYIIYFFINKFGLRITMVISLFFYGCSLLGDSYYGILPVCKLKNFIDTYIFYFGEVWNSFIWVLIFILFGIVIKKYNLNKKITHGKYVFLIVYCLFILEHFILKYLNIERDNNTSIFLLILAPVIFINILNLEDKVQINYIKSNAEILKNLSLNIYLVHPLIKLYIIKFLNIDKSFILFAIVLSLSIIVSYLIYYIKKLIYCKQKYKRSNL